MTETNITIAGDWSKPASVLIEKVSSAIGGLCRPAQIIRVANAESQAALIHAETDIQITDLHKRAMHRFLDEEAKKQLNIETITTKALPLVRDDSSPSHMDNDWITNFFDKCRIISDEDMQIIWSRILAGEANAPGTFSKRTTNLLADLDKRDARLFADLCRFVWKIDDYADPLVNMLELNFYAENNINFDTLCHLETAGLIKFNVPYGFQKDKLSEKLVVSYFEKNIELDLRGNAAKEIPCGHVLFSQSGRELAGVCDVQPVAGFFEYIYNWWLTEGYISPVENESQAQQ